LPHTETDGITQQAAHALENRRLSPEMVHRRRLALRDFFDQKIQDLTVVSGESLDEIGCVLVVPQGERSRANGRCGSSRVAMTRCIWGGRRPRHLSPF
jgi:hypothetical protein